MSILTHPEAKKQLALCRAAPRDPKPRQDLANWLDRRGESAAAACLRESLATQELVFLPDTDQPKWSPVRAFHCGWAHGWLDENPDSVRERIEQLSTVSGSWIASVDWQDEGFDTQAFEEIAACASAMDLVVLDIHANGARARGAAAFAASKFLAGLTHLSLGENGIRDDGAVALSSSTVLLNLLHLSLTECRITDTGATALANSPVCQHLTHLNLWGNQITRSGAAAVIASPYLKNLTYLNLAGNKLDDESKADVLTRFPFAFV